MPGIPSHSLSVELASERLELLGERALWWPERRVLFIADAHLGKAGHFRKAGIPVPQAVGEAGLRRLKALCEAFHPEELYFLGDLFHSDRNAEWEALCALLAEFPATRFTLVLGNHDILGEEDYGPSPLQVVAGGVVLGPFFLCHEPDAPCPEGLYRLSGHIHPAYRLQGRGRQSLLLPCFHFTAEGGTLPAFGEFTGKHPVTAKAPDRVFVVAEGRVFEVEGKKA
jgi:DNA ligase-associated metallophosphoesterase